MLKMDSEFVSVKIEPMTDSEDSLHGNEDKTSVLGKQIEFIPIKTEISDSPPQSPVSLTAEELSVPVNHEGIPLLHPDGEPLVSVKCEPDEDESSEVPNPATMVAVTYKLEPNVDDNELNQFADPTLILPDTSDMPLDNGGVVLSDIVEGMLRKDLKNYKSELAESFYVIANQKRPKTAAERMREHRARKKMIKLSVKDVSVTNNHNFKVETDCDLRNTPEVFRDCSQMSSEYRDVKVNDDNSASDVSSTDHSQDIRLRDNRPELYHRQPKTAAERMREYRARKKIRKQSANGVPLENQYSKYDVIDKVVFESEDHLNNPSELFGKRPKTSREGMREHRATKKIGDHTESYVTIEQEDNVGVEANYDFRNVPESFYQKVDRARPKTAAERMREYRRRKKNKK